MAVGDVESVFALSGERQLPTREASLYLNYRELNRAISIGTIQFAQAEYRLCRNVHGYHEYHSHWTSVMQ